MDRNDTRLNIALIRQRYTAFGGAERFLDRAMRALGRENASITLITRQWRNDGEFRVEVCDPFYAGRLWRDWSFARAVCKRLRAGDFDLVQSHERIACCDVYRAGDGVHREWLAQRRRVLSPLGRMALAVHPYHRYLLAAEKALFASPRLKAVICNSRMVQEEIQARFGVPAGKLHVIHSGVDIARYHPDLKARYRAVVRQQWGIPESATLFLFVGAAFERKGLRILLETLPALPDHARLMVVGKDKKMNAYLRLAEKLGVRERVHFAGAQQDTTPYYGAADVLVLPTLYDPFPNVVLEAMAAALPVITSLKCGAVDLIQNGVNGYTCDALDRDALQRHMRELLGQEKRDPMGAAARATVEPLTLEAMGKKLIALYTYLIDDTRTADMRRE